MSDHPAWLPELHDLFDRLQDDDFSEDDRLRLNELLAAGEEQRRCFITYVDIHSWLAWEGIEKKTPSGERLVFATPQPPSSPVLAFLGSAAHGTFGYISSGWPLAYLAATMIFGVGLLIGSLVHVSYPEQMARQSSVPSRLDAEAKVELVGWVTGMVDCKWAGAALDSRVVPLGRKYELASGLMEITYDTGAKVILQGPVTYEVESPAGGFLSVGKLTAKMEKKVVSGQWPVVSKPEIPNPQSPTPNPSLSTNHYPLFTIKTPTATVTDLGTEFGVEVSKTGTTETHVFVGKVRVAGPAAARGAAEQILLAGQAVRLGPHITTAAVFESSNKRFVRKMPVAQQAAVRELIGQIDYGDTWTANSPTRAGSYLLLNDPESSGVEQCHGNPPRRWVCYAPTAMTTWPSDNSPVPWPGHKAPGSKSGFSETICNWDGYLGFEYGLRDDFVVQFDAVQTDDRINITIGDKPATIYSPQSLSVFFRVAGAHSSEIDVFTLPKGGADTGLRSGIDAPWQWHNYAVRFNLREKRLTVWVDRRCRGTIDLAGITAGMKAGSNGSWASLPWTNQYVTIGGYSRKGPTRVWTDNFRIGSARETEQ